MKQEELNKLVGERLRKCIKEKNIKQSELASLSNFTEQHISKLVKGKSKLTTETARILARILEVRIEYLLYEDDFKTEFDRFSLYLKNIEDIHVNICNLLESKGYRLVNDDYINSCEPFKIISLSYPHEIKGKTAQEIQENINDKLLSSSEQNMIALKHPDGRIIRITSDQFYKSIEDMENYIDYQMHRLFNAPQNYLFTSDMKTNNDKRFILLDNGVKNGV